MLTLLNKAQREGSPEEYSAEVANHGGAPAKHAWYGKVSEDFPPHCKSLGRYLETKADGAWVMARTEKILPL